MKYAIISCLLLTACAGDPARVQAYRQQQNASPSGQHEKTVYSASQCTGAIVAGVCHGGIIPNPALQKTCHGEMLNGQCTGPMF